jgi:hypothetical protein
MSTADPADLHRPSVAAGEVVQQVMCDACSLEAKGERDALWARIRQGLFDHVWVRTRMEASNSFWVFTGALPPGGAGQVPGRRAGYTKSDSSWRPSTRVSSRAQDHATQRSAIERAASARGDTVGIST